MQVTLSFDYEMILSPGYDAGEFSRLLVSIDGGEAILIEELLASGELTAADSVSLDLGSLGAGSHTLAIGGYINQKSWSDERSEEHTSELQSLMRLSYAVFCLQQKNQTTQQ